MIRVTVANPYDYPLDYAVLKAAASTVLQAEGIRDAKIIIAFVNDPHIHRLNKQFLDHDEPTDVLTFPYTEPASRKLEGEIVIGYETAQAHAQDRGHDLTWELQLDVIHGCLHLCGYDDRSPAEARLMRRKEREYLQQLGLPDITHEE